MNSSNIFTEYLTVKNGICCCCLMYEAKSAQFEASCWKLRFIQSANVFSHMMREKCSFHCSCSHLSLQHPAVCKSIATQNTILCICKNISVHATLNFSICQQKLSTFQHHFASFSSNPPTLEKLIMNFASQNVTYWSF